MPFAQHHTERIAAGDFGRGGVDQIDESEGRERGSEEDSPGPGEGLKALRGTGACHEQEEGHGRYRDRDERAFACQVRAGEQGDQRREACRAGDETQQVFLLARERRACGAKHHAAERHRRQHGEDGAEQNHVHLNPASTSRNAHSLFQTGSVSNATVTGAFAAIHACGHVFFENELPRSVTAEAVEQLPVNEAGDGYGAGMLEGLTRNEEAERKLARARAGQPKTRFGTAPGPAPAAVAGAFDAAGDVDIGVGIGGAQERTKGPRRRTRPRTALRGQGNRIRRARTRGGNEGREQRGDQA